MATTKKGRPEYPEINMLRAVILDRKLTMGLSYEDLAEGCGTSGIYIRKLMATKDPDHWNPDIRAAVCKRVGLDVETTVRVETTIRVQTGDGSVTIK